MLSALSNNSFCTLPQKTIFKGRIIPLHGEAANPFYLVVPVLKSQTDERLNAINGR